MQSRYSTQVKQLTDAVLTGPGVTDATLRQTIEAFSALCDGRPGVSNGEIPTVLRTYVEKVARCAYKTTDTDVQTLRQAGYSEDAIFEITVSAALGAGLARLERGLAALEGGE